MSRVRVPVAVVLSMALGACGGKARDPDAAPVKPDCVCDDRMAGCDCPHCMSRDAGLDESPCPCAGRGYK